MFRHRQNVIILNLLAMFTVAIFPATLAAPRSSAAPEKTVWNRNGGLYLETDGALRSGICFKISGRVTAAHFFDDLKRIDKKDAETVFQRGKETVTEFPERLLLQFALYDYPCADKLQETGPRQYLTRSIVSGLQLSLYWKRGLELRPLTDFTPVGLHIRPIFPFDADAKDLPDRFEWDYDLIVPSAGVPLTDSLVLVIRTQEQKVAARVAAHM
jgi:hypothetical protein